MGSIADCKLHEGGNLAGELGHSRHLVNMGTE